MKCEICNKDIKLKGFATHITSHHRISCQMYYDTYINDNDGICKTCGKPTKFLGIKFGYREHCCNRCAQLDPKIKEKKAQTCIDRYGVDNVYKSEDIKAKIQETTRERYGVNNVLQLDEVRQKTYASIKSDEVKNSIVKTKVDEIHKFEQENDCTLYTTLRKQYGQGWIHLPLERLTLHGHASFIKNSDIPKIIDYIEQQGSSFEYDVRNYVKSIYNGEIITNTRSIISPLELDMYIPEKNLAIECNGIFWHSSLNSVDKNYHYNKSRRCQELDIRLIHIYENEWFEQKDKIKWLLDIALDHTNKIYTKQCEVRIINNQEAKQFNEATHLRGHIDAQVTYGLFYNNKLIQLMSFSKTKHNEWKIIRSCYSSTVIGGMSTLFKHFIDDYKPKTVFGYCDFNKFDGKSYEELGMTCIGYTGPNKWLVIDNTLTNKTTENARGILWDSGSIEYKFCAKGD